jgi:hypothetical protein
MLVAAADAQIAEESTAGPDSDGGQLAEMTLRLAAGGHRFESVPCSQPSENLIAAEVAAINGLEVAGVRFDRSTLEADRSNCRNERRRASFIG